MQGGCDGRKIYNSSGVDAVVVLFVEQRRASLPKLQKSTFLPRRSSHKTDTSRALATCALRLDSRSFLGGCEAKSSCVGRSLEANCCLRSTCPCVALNVHKILTRFQKLGLKLRFQNASTSLPLVQGSGFAAKAINEMMPEKRHANLKCRKKKLLHTAIGVKKAPVDRRFASCESLPS